ncbi:glycosyltransferase [Bacillus sp. 03113]|uniref:glycosyltransferase n=1 Tax=Bacillus sp. 03113 TaxID=2578211 RepID=UPI001141ECB7|nr:glycosyltransferase [Bacillus sp. 03113]
MNIGYVIFCESIFDAILKTQVINLLKQMSKKSNHRFSIYWFCPIKNYITRRNEIINLTEELSEFNIKLKVVPIVYLTRWFNVKIVHIPLVYQMLIPLIYFIKKDKIDVFHVRSYPGAIPFTLLKRAFNKVNFILDTRSDFVEENSLFHWKNNRVTINYWMKKEKKLYETSDKIIAISENFANQKLADFKSKTYIIPNNVTLDNNKLDLEFRNEFRKEKNLVGKIVYCYLGSLGNGWNQLETYMKFFKENKQLMTNFHFLLLTPKVNKIQNELKNYDISESNYTVKSVPNNEVVKYLTVADFGLQFMTHKDSRIGIKVVEYLTAGLPVIVNENVGGAASIINKNSLGIVLNNETLPESELTNIINNYNETSSKCKTFAKENFSTEVVASKYLDVYQSIIKEVN